LSAADRESLHSALSLGTKTNTYNKYLGDITDNVLHS